MLCGKDELLPAGLVRSQVTNRGCKYFFCRASPRRACVAVEGVREVVEVLASSPDLLFALLRYVPACVKLLDSCLLVTMMSSSSFVGHQSSVIPKSRI